MTDIGSFNAYSKIAPRMTPQRTMGRPRFPFTVVVILALFITLRSEQAFATCAAKQNFTLSGKCVTYPSDGFCGPAYAGRSIFLANDTSLALAEALARTSVELLQRNSDQVSAGCIDATSKYVCANWFPRCQVIGGEAIPLLPCQSECEAYWETCRSGFNLYLFAIQNLQIGTIEDVNIIHCGTGTWNAAPQPSDYFGGRNIPLQPTWIEGYRGELRHPNGPAQFKLKNGTNISVPCDTITNFAYQLDLGNELKCAYPLTKTTIDGQEKCALPCPFPVIPLADLKVIGWAFVVPALIGVVFSVFVCVDTLWAMFDVTNGGGCYNRVRGIWARSTVGSRHDGSSADQVMSGAESSGTTGRFRSGKIRASMVYALLGSILGIVYFIIGPLMTLIYSEKISCDGKAFLDIGDVIAGTQQIGNSMCSAQRVAPFVLQGIFNLMFYALFRVMIMVDQRFKRWTQQSVNLARIVILAYCGLGPFVTMGIALGVDKATDNLTLVFGQLARNSAICTMRLTTGQEIVLVFLPFIITGICITALSLYIWLRLSSIQAGVQGLITDKNRASDRALNLLMRRLSVLGVATFIVIIILIGSTSYVINSMALFSPRFNSFFGCVSTSTTCAVTADCNALKADAYAVSPSFDAFAVQIAAMSCISLLLSGFFAAQSAPRLFNEWRTGALAQKLDNILEGRPLHYHVGTRNESSVQDAPKAGTGTASPTKLRGKSPSFEGQSVAAYMSGFDTTTPSPVFEHEMSESKGPRRVEDANSNGS